MSVTLFNTGIIITDEQAMYLYSFCETIMIHRYRELNGGQYPPQWPFTTGAQRKAFVEWSIKRLVIDNLIKHEHFDTEI